MAFYVVILVDVREHEFRIGAFFVSYSSFMLTFGTNGFSSLNTFRNVPPDELLVHFILD